MNPLQHFCCLLLIGNAVAQFSVATETDKKLVAPTASKSAPRILFTTLRKGNVHIMLVNADGTGAQALTSGPTNNFCPSWSRDGKKIVFSYQDSRGKGLCLMDADGRNLKRLTYGTDTGAAWSPDGKMIAYTHHIQPNTWRIMTITMNAAAESPPASDNAQPTADVHYVKELTDGSAYDADPAWSPDGKTIAFASARLGNGFRLFLMNADGTNVRDLSQSDNPGGNVFPTWSPDGKRIAYTDWVDEDSTRQIFVIDADGKNKKQLTTKGNFNCYAAWSPDGKQIAYTSYSNEKSKGSLARMNPDGSQQKIVLRDQGAGHNGRPAWKPK